MILSPRSARLVPRELDGALRARALASPHAATTHPRSAFQEAFACVGKCGSVSVERDRTPSWEPFNDRRALYFVEFMCLFNELIGSNYN